MKKQISFAQYRLIDLAVLLAVLALCQGLTHFAAVRWFPDQLYVAAPVAGMVALVMMRWGVWSGIHAVLGGLLFAALAGAGWQHYLIYGGGNALCLLALPLLLKVGKERIRGNVILSFAFALGIQILMWLGRAGLAWILGFPPAASLGFITTDALSGLFTLLIVWVIRRVDGLFEDQKTYLLRIHREQEAEGREPF